MTQQSYDAVPVFSGRPMTAPAESGFFQPPATTSENNLLSTDQARAVAEVKAALVIAASRPRNELQARDRLLQACQRIGLASSAIYKYNRGGSNVTGPSIRLAETAARAWGNITYGFRELTRNAGVSECEAFAWDLETNTKAVRQFSVRHRRDTKKGGYDLTEERDIYELMANQAQRRVRAAILEIIPGDIIEDALEQCEKTMSANVSNVGEATKKLVQAFADLGVTREAIEKRLGHRIEATQPAEILNFRKIYTSIQDGMSEAKDWFEMEQSENALPANQVERPEEPAKAKKSRGRRPKSETIPVAEPEQPLAQTQEYEVEPSPTPDPEDIQESPDSLSEPRVTPMGSYEPPVMDQPTEDAAALARARYDAQEDAFYSM